ncbi:MAG: amidohydrolase [Chloroflexota bacterium]|nr:amidohydrolase [Chloroflexota bacterium]
MTVVDSHCHVSPIWYEPVELLLFQMDRNAVDRAVLIQMQGQCNNDYLFSCVQRFPGRFLPVVIVDVTKRHGTARLERLVDQGAAGVRLNATDRSAGPDPLAIWRAAERLGLPVSCAGRATEFASPQFDALVAEVPNLPIVIEHLGGPREFSAAPESPLRDRVFQLSRFANIFMKITGLGEFCRRALPPNESFPFERPIPPLLELALRAFGPGRLMWGSDYPPVSQREGYGNALTYARAEVPSDDQAPIFGDVAARVFGSRDALS